MIRRDWYWREVRYYYNHSTRLTILPLSERKPRLACSGCNGKLHRYIHKKIGVTIPYFLSISFRRIPPPIIGFVILRRIRLYSIVSSFPLFFHRLRRRSILSTSRRLLVSPLRSTTLSSNQSSLPLVLSPVTGGPGDINNMLGSSTLEHNQVIPSEVPHDFHVIWLRVAVKQSPIHWCGGLTRYLEELWRATNELRVGVLVMDRGGSDVSLDYARACQDRSSRRPSSLESSSIGLRLARACSCATLRSMHDPDNEYGKKLMIMMEVNPHCNRGPVTQWLAHPS